MKSYIQLNELNKTFDLSYYDSQGRLFFDLFQDFELPTEESIAGLDALNNINELTVFSNTLPYTRKNSVILRYYLDLYGSVYDSVLVPVIVSDVNGMTIFNKIRISEFEENGNEISIDIINTESFLYKLSKVKLSDVTFPIYTFDNANVISDWNNNRHYFTDGDKGVYFPLALYKSKFQDSESVLTVDKARLQELRPFVNLYYLMKQIFCLAGYTMDAPLLDSPFGRQKWLYLLKDTFYNIGGKGTYFKARANLAVPYTDNAGQPLKIDTINYDAGNRYNNATYFYTNNTPYTINVRVQYDLIVSALVIGNNTDTWGILIEDAFAVIDSTNLSNKFNDLANSPVTTGFAFVTLVYDIELKAGSKFFFQTSNAGGNGWNLIWSSGTRFTVDATGQYIYPLDTFRANELFNTDYTGVDLLKGTMHLINGKLSIDENKKIGRLLHSESNGDGITAGIEQYYINEGQAFDYTKDVITNSYKAEFNQVEQKRYLNFGYFQGSDALVDKVDKMRDNTTANGFRFDLGASKRYKEGTDSFENPFFEAVVNRHVLIGLKLADNLNLDMPVIWDNEFGAAESFNISPKIVHIYGSQQQYRAIEGYTGTDRFKQLFLDGVLITSLPLSYQFTTQTVNIGTNYNLSVNNLMDYGSLIPIFYQKSLEQKKNVALFSIQILGKQNILNFNIRKPILVQTTEGYRYFRVISFKKLQNGEIMELDILPILSKKC